MLRRRAFLLGGFGLAARPHTVSSLPISLEISLDPARWQIGPINSWQKLFAWDAVPAHSRGYWLELQLSGTRRSPLRHNAPDWLGDWPSSGQGSVRYHRARALGAYSGRPTRPYTIIPAAAGRRLVGGLG